MGETKILAKYVNKPQIHEKIKNKYYLFLEKTIEFQFLIIFSCLQVCLPFR